MAATKPFQILRRLINDPAYRSLAYLRLFARDLHQTTIWTEVDRYPDIFSECQTLLRDDPGQRILSFGCSTGEEPASLRKYFPHSMIFGTDINANNIAICKQIDRECDLTFFRSSRRNIRRHGPYNAIFCMAVLQRTPHLINDRGINDISQIYSFSKFDAQLSELDKCLAPGGVMIIEHSQYRFLDSSIGSRYACSPFRTAIPSGVSKFDRNGIKIDHGSFPVIFIKRE